MKSPHHVLMLVFLVLTVAPLTPLSGGEHAFVGAKKCKGCHMKEWKSWSETKMARSFDLLKPGERSTQKKAAGLDPDKDYTADEECIPCHVTGYGRPGGFVSFEKTPDLAGVGCEMCHGPGYTYLKPEYMSLKNKEYKRADLVKAGLVAEPTVELCDGCHNTRSPFVGDDYVFDFESKRDEGTHEKYPLKYEH